jgi:hypothetical protein
VVALFGYVTACYYVGGAVWARMSRQDEEPWIGVLVGILALQVAGLVPVLGPLAVGLVSIAGLGATLLALKGWRRARKGRAGRATGQLAGGTSATITPAN